LRLKTGACPEGSSEKKLPKRVEQERKRKKIKDQHPSLGRRATKVNLAKKDRGGKKERLGKVMGGNRCQEWVTKWNYSGDLP